MILPTLPWHSPVLILPSDERWKAESTTHFDTTVCFVYSMFCRQTVVSRSDSDKCVCVCVCDSDAVWGGEWGRWRDGSIGWGVDRRREWAVLGVNLGRPIVTNGNLVA